MIDILLVLVIVWVIAYHMWDSYEESKKQDKLINAVIARNAQELTNLKLAEQTKVVVQKPQANNSDLIPTDEMTQGQFESMIEHENRVIEETSEI